MHPGERIAQIRDSLSMNQTDFGALFGKKQTQIRDMELGKQKVNVDFSLQIEEKTGFSGWWILTGKGTQKKNSQNLPSGTVTVNLYEDVYAAAGYGAENDRFFPPVAIQISAEVLRDVFNVHSTASVDIINVYGDSMEPFFHHGDRIIVERTHEAADNNIVIALVDGQLFVKRLLKDPLGRWVKLTSTNEFYPDIPLEGEEIDRLRIVGIVRGKWRPI